MKEAREQTSREERGREGEFILAAMVVAVSESAISEQMPSFVY